MGFSRELTLTLSRYIIGNKLRGKRQLPLVLMLEPSFRCNLSCAGCGRIREYHDITDKMLSTRECLDSVEEANTPVICVTGGEPLLHPEIDKIISGILQQKRFAYLSTNGLLLEQSLDKFKPSPYFSFVLHMDNLAEAHDRFAGRKGVFDTALSAAKAAHRKGFRVLINTTIYRTTEIPEIRQLFLLLKSIPVDGLMVAPAFGYQGVDNEIILSRNETVSVFKFLYEMHREFPYYNTAPYWEFLAGKRKLACTPWSTPTRNPEGWKRPCYLITDSHCKSFRELMQETNWEKYGTGNDPRCANCMVHCGYEASAIETTLHSLPALWNTISWNILKS